MEMNAGKAVFIVAVVAFLGMAAYLFSQGGKGGQGEMRTPEGGAATAPAAVPDPNAMEETRPTLPPSTFSGRAEAAYRIAAEIPAVIDKLHCFCECKENPNFKHKTLLTCYVDDHAAECGICMQEAEMAQEMTRAGKSPAEIRAAVDAHFKEMFKR